MASIEKEKIGNLHEKIVVKVSRDDYYPSFEKTIKDYSKKANIPGFRKGMVPVGMVKKMYGAALYQEEVIKSVENKLRQYLNDEKPAIFAQPLPMQNDVKAMNMNEPADYEFPFEIGLKPEVSLEVLKSSKPILYKVNVNDAMVDVEIEKLLTKNGSLKDVEKISDNENMINALFEESSAEGEIITDGISKENSLLVKYFTPALQEQLMGKGVGDFIVSQLKNAFEDKESEAIVKDLSPVNDDVLAKEKYFKITINKVGIVEKKQLNEEFFKLVFPGKEIDNTESFKALVKGEMQNQWDLASRNHLHDALYHTLIQSPIELPQVFLKRWLENGDGKQKSPEEIENEFPEFEKQLKWTLLSDKIMAENNIEVPKEEIKESMKQEISRYFGQMNLGNDVQWLDSYIDRMMADDKQVESTYRKLVTEKLFAWLETQVQPEEKAITAEEFEKLERSN